MLFQVIQRFGNLSLSLIQIRFRPSMELRFSRQHRGSSRFQPNHWVSAQRSGIYWRKE